MTTRLSCQTLLRLHQLLTRGKISQYILKQILVTLSLVCARNLHRCNERFWITVLFFLFTIMSNVTTMVSVSGIVRPGECLAVMGASGAGKTTLLNCLTFRGSSKMLKTVGQRYLNGQLTNTDTLARVSGYVQQDDLFVPSLTVWEHLRFQVPIRIPSNVFFKPLELFKGIASNGRAFDV